MLIEWKWEEFVLIIHERFKNKSFRADDPQELVQLQEEKWDPLLDWMEKRLVE